MRTVVRLHVYPRSEIYRQPFVPSFWRCPPITNERPITTQENHLARCEITYYYLLSLVAPREAWVGLVNCGKCRKRIWNSEWLNNAKYVVCVDVTYLQQNYTSSITTVKWFSLIPNYFLHRPTFYQAYPWPLLTTVNSCSLVSEPLTVRPQILIPQCICVLCLSL